MHHDLAKVMLSGMVELREWMPNFSYSKSSLITLGPERSKDRARNCSPAQKSKINFIIMLERLVSWKLVALPLTISLLHHTVDWAAIYSLHITCLWFHPAAQTKMEGRLMRSHSSPCFSSFNSVKSCSDCWEMVRLCMSTWRTYNDR